MHKILARLSLENTINAFKRFYVHGLRTYVWKFRTKNQNQSNSLNGSRQKFSFLWWIKLHNEFLTYFWHPSKITRRTSSKRTSWTLCMLHKVVLMQAFSLNYTKCRLICWTNSTDLFHGRAFFFLGLIDVWIYSQKSTN